MADTIGVEIRLLGIMTSPQETAVPSADTHAQDGRVRIASPGSLRAAEKCALAFFVYTAAAGWFFPISSGQRLTLLILNVAAAGVPILLARSERLDSRLLLSLRDWLPCALIVLAYRESGLFIQPDVTRHLDELFIAWDRALLASGWFQGLVSVGSPWLGPIMELAYLLVYPFVPLGFAAVYFAKRGARDANQHRAIVDRYWTAVLLAVLVSYALFPFFPLTPPRVLYHDFPGGPPDAFLRGLNSWVLNHYSVQACIFPSGHVAGAVATALAVRSQRPRLGIVFLVAAALIAASTVYGRYHYSADALAGAAVGVAAFVGARFLAHQKK